MTDTTDKITWERIVQQCSELGRMRDEASKVDGSDPYFCANDVWFERFKPRLLRLVGWEALPGFQDWMYSDTAYDIAYQTIYNELPCCRMCACM